MKAGLTDITHMALVVADIEDAMRRYGAAFGLTWAQPWRGEMPVVAGDQETSPMVTFTFSKQGPPHLELIEQVPDTVWQPTRGLHHVGVWVDDVPAAAERMAADGFVTEVMGVSGEFAYLLAEDGFRLELVDRKAEPEFARWLAGGRL